MKNVKQLEILGSETGDSQITIFPHAFSQYRIQDDGRQEEKLEQEIDERYLLIRAMDWKSFDY